MRERGSFTGLVVEDEWLLRLELAEELAHAGWRIMEAASGEEALKQLKLVPALDFLITDIRLSGALDGWAVAEAARKAHPNLPVLYVSANPVQPARQVAGSLFLGKPVDMAQLLEACDRLVLRG
jgi:CheY-like chemotaxis protein